MRSLVTALTLVVVSSSVVIAQEAVEVPKEALQEMSCLVGEWETSVSLNGEKLVGEYSAEWAPGKHCLILSSSLSGDEATHASGVGGWSPDRKQYVEHWFTSDGVNRTVYYTIGEKKGTWVGTIEAVDKDGKKGSGTAHLEANDAEFRGVGVLTLAGEKTEIKYVCKRK